MAAAQAVADVAPLVGSLTNLVEERDRVNLGPRRRGPDGRDVLVPVPALAGAAKSARFPDPDLQQPDMFDCGRRAAVTPRATIFETESTLDLATGRPRRPRRSTS